MESFVVVRYCAGRKSKRKRGKVGGADYSGASHIAELHALLRATVMVRLAFRDTLTKKCPLASAICGIPI